MGNFGKEWPENYNWPFKSALLHPLWTHLHSTIEPHLGRPTHPAFWTKRDPFRGAFPDPEVMFDALFR